MSNPLLVTDKPLAATVSAEQVALPSTDSNRVKVVLAVTNRDAPGPTVTDGPTATAAVARVRLELAALNAPSPLSVAPLTAQAVAVENVAGWLTLTDPPVKEQLPPVTLASATTVTVPVDERPPLNVVDAATDSVPDTDTAPKSVVVTEVAAVPLDPTISAAENEGVDTDSDPFATFHVPPVPPTVLPSEQTTLVDQMTPFTFTTPPLSVQTPEVTLLAEAMSIVPPLCLSPPENVVNPFRLSRALELCSTTSDPKVVALLTVTMAADANTSGAPNEPDTASTAPVDGVCTQEPGPLTLTVTLQAVVVVKLTPASTLTKVPPVKLHESPANVSPPPTVSDPPVADTACMVEPAPLTDKLPPVKETRAVNAIGTVWNTADPPDTPRAEPNA